MPNCTHCERPIDEEFYVSAGAITLHNDCKDPYLLAKKEREAAASTTGETNADQKNETTKSGAAATTTSVAGGETVSGHTETPANAGVCAECDKEIPPREPFLEAHGIRLHKGCFDAFAKRTKTTEVFHERVLCGHCNQMIEEKEFLKDGDLPIHQLCKDAYLKEKQRMMGNVCSQCNEPIMGQYYELGSAPGKKFHGGDCLDQYKAATRPKCCKCDKPILDNSYMQSGDGTQFYHNQCKV